MLGGDHRTSYPALEEHPHEETMQISIYTQDISREEKTLPNGGFHEIPQNPAHTAPQTSSSLHSYRPESISSYPKRHSAHKSKATARQEDKKRPAVNPCPSVHYSNTSFDQSPVSHYNEHLTLQILPQSKSLETFRLDSSSPGVAAAAMVSVSSDINSIPPPYSTLDDMSSDGFSSRSNTAFLSSVDGIRSSPFLMRRTPSYTSAIGGSFSSEHSIEMSPNSSSSRSRRYDGKKYIGVQGGSVDL